MRGCCEREEYAKACGLYLDWLDSWGHLERRSAHLRVLARYAAGKGRVLVVNGTEVMP